MTSALILLLVAVAAAWPVSTLLANSAWPSRFPRVGLLAWYALGVVMVGSVILGGLVIASPRHVGSVTLALRELVAQWSGRHPFSHVTFSAAVGLSIAVDAAAAVVVIIAMTALRLHRQRSHHRRILGVVGTRVDRGTVLVEYPQPLAYFVPGLGGRIVLSTGMTRRFTGAEISSVVAHEGGHRRGHHGALLLPFHSFATHFRWLPFARLASEHVTELVEFSADDHAVRTEGRGALLGALQHMIGVDHPTPACALGVGGSTLVARIERLNSPATVAFSDVLSVVVAMSAVWLAVVGVLLR